MICGQCSLRNKSLLAFSVNAFEPLSLWCGESEELRMAAQLDGFPRFKCLTLPGASSLFPRLVSLSRSSPFVCRLLLPLLFAWCLLPGAFPVHVFPLSSFIVRTPLQVSHIISQLTTLHCLRESLTKAQ